MEWHETNKEAHSYLALFDSMSISQKAKKGYKGGSSFFDELVEVTKGYLPSFFVSPGKLMLM